MAEESAAMEDCPKCEKCKPGLPGWMATFSDLVTLLLTFFVLLLSFAKTESAKYEAALGSIRNAFGGNAYKKGEVVQLGRSADNQPTMVESSTPVKPFPVEFMTTEGFLDKHEVNRESAETLNLMKQDLESTGLADNVNVFEEKEGIKVNLKDKIYFKKGTTSLKEISIEVVEKLVKILNERNWVVFIKGHSSIGEQGDLPGVDTYMLSSMRATAVMKALNAKGVERKRMTIISYGDSRPIKASKNTRTKNDELSRRVEIMIRKRDLESPGHKVDAY